MANATDFWEVLHFVWKEGRGSGIIGRVRRAVEYVCGADGGVLSVTKFSVNAEILSSLGALVVVC